MNEIPEQTFSQGSAADLLAAVAAALAAAVAASVFCIAAVAAG